MVLDLDLSGALLSKVHAVAELAEREHAETDRPDGTPARTLAAVAEHRLDRLAINDVDLPAFAEVLMGVATAFPAAAVVLTMHAAVLHLASASSDTATRARVLDGGRLWGFGAAPPAEEARARVEKHADGARLRGALRRVSGAGLVGGLAALVPYGEKNAVLLVETDRAGVEIEPSWQSAGLRASSTRVVRFHDVAVTRADVLALVVGAEELPSWSTAMLGLVATAAGVARRAARLSIERARAVSDATTFRRDSGVALAAAIEEATAAMSICRALAVRARRPSVDHVELLAAKRAATSAAERSVVAARAVVGMDGFEPPHPLERLSRDALGLRHFFPVDPVALELSWSVLGLRSLDPSDGRSR